VGSFHRSGVIIFLNVEDIEIRVNGTANYFSGNNTDGYCPVAVQKNLLFFGELGCGFQRRYRGGKTCLVHLGPIFSIQKGCPWEDFQGFWKAKRRREGVLTPGDYSLSSSPHFYKM
jgi:hypothetical protein